MTPREPPLAAGCVPQRFHMRAKRNKARWRCIEGAVLVDPASSELMCEMPIIWNSGDKRGLHVLGGGPGGLDTLHDKIR